MKNFLNRKILTITTFFIASLVIESFLFIYLDFGILPKYVMFDIALLLFMSFIIFCIPFGIFQDIFIVLLTIIQMALAYTNICMYKMLDTVFTFEQLALIKETKQVLIADMLPVWPIVFYSVLFAVVVSTLFILKKIKVQKYNHSSAVKFVVKGIAIIGMTISFVIYTVSSTWIIKGNKGDSLYLFSDKELYSTFSSNKVALEKFGSWGFYFEEFFRQFYDVEDTVNYTKAELNAYVSHKEYKPTDLTLYGKAEGDNVVSIMLESFEWYAINPELTPVLYALATGYDFGTKADGYSRFYDIYDFEYDSNGFTDLIRKDYELDSETKLFVKKEGVEVFNEEYMWNYGLTLTNYYSKSKTDYSEASFILGNYPNNESFTIRGLMGYSSRDLHPDIDYGFTLPNMLEEFSGLKSKYMHGYMSSFYGRDRLIKQFGFDSALFLDGMSSKIDRQYRLAHICKDSQIMDYYLNLTNGEKFIDDGGFSHYTTVTTHGEYSTNYLLQKHYTMVDSIGFLGQTQEGKESFLTNKQESAVRTYLASALDSEYMVTILVKYLMENDLFDSTILCLFADHQAYYDDLDLYYKSLYFSDEEGEYSSPMAWQQEEEYGEEYGGFNQDRYKVPAFIYSTKLTDEVVGGKENHQISKLTCAFDLTTTILTLKGINYNPSFYLGYPVICDVYDETLGKVVNLGVPAICSSTGGVFDTDIYTEEGVTLVYKKSSVKDENEIMKFSYNVAKYIERWRKITALYQYDMFAIK